MATEPEVQYWDSCMFISLLTGKDARRTGTIKALIEHENKGLIRIVISTFVIAEVRPDESNPNLENGQFQAAVELLESDRLHSWALTPHIALEAQKIGQRFPKLLPGDCVHIATAIAAGAATLFTFDGVGPKRRRPSEMIAHSGEIGNPPLKICEPFIPAGPLFERAPRLPSPR